MPYNNDNCNNLSNIVKNNISNNNKILNNKENNMNFNNSNINPLNNVKFNYGEINYINNDIKSAKNDLSNSNIIIDKMLNPNFASNKKCTPESLNNNYNRIQINNNLNSNVKEQNQKIKDININKLKKLEIMQ